MRYIAASLANQSADILCVDDKRCYSIQKKRKCTKEDISEEKNEVESSLQLNFDHFLGINVIETGNDFPEQISINATGADSVDQSEPIIHNFELEGFEQSDFPI